MKNTLKKSLPIVLVFLVLFAVPSLACDAYEECWFYPMSINRDYQFKVYSDIECTEQIQHIEKLTAGTEYYYQINCREGFYVKSVFAGTNVVDHDSFVFNDEFYLDFEGYLAGDFDYNYTVNVMDAIHIVKYGLHYQYDEEYINLRAADFNQDGYVDTRDAIQVVNTLVGLEENPYGGVQSDFEVVTDIPYELGEEIAISYDYAKEDLDKYNDEYDLRKHNPIVFSSANDFKDFWADKTNAFEEVGHSFPDDEYLQEIYIEQSQLVRDTYPLDTEALFAKYDENFFAENNLIITSIGSSAECADKFLSFTDINGVPTISYYDYRGGARLEPYFLLLRLIAVDKDEIPADTEITNRVIYSYHIC